MDHKFQSKSFIIRNILPVNLRTGTDLAINFDLVKCITKNRYTKTSMGGWTESFHQKARIYQQDKCILMVYSRKTGTS